MARKLKKVVLINPPKASDIQSLQADFHQVFGAVNPDSIVIFTIDSPSRLVFAKLDANKEPDFSQTISLELPCPPYCGTDYQSQVNVLTIN